MKPKIFLAPLLLFFAALFISCGPKPGKDPADEESGYEIDLSKFEVSYGQGTSYDKKTFTFIDAENPSENGSLIFGLKVKEKILQITIV